MSKTLYYVTAIIIVIAVALAALFYRDVSKANEISALGDCTPYNIQFENVTSQSFIVNWQTKINCSGIIKYGEEMDNIVFIASEIGDSSAKRDHSITVEGLSYSTQYYLLVISSQVEYGNNNLPLQVKTKAL